MKKPKTNENTRPDTGKKCAWVPELGRVTPPFGAVFPGHVDDAGRPVVLALA